MPPHALFDDFLLSLKERRFYDAHEALEALWFPRRFEKSGEVQLLKGLINAAVSFELIRKGRPDASERAWKTYLKYRPLLETLQSEHLPSYREMTVEVEKIRSQNA